MKARQALAIFWQERKKPELRKCVFFMTPYQNAKFGTPVISCSKCRICRPRGMGFRPPKAKGHENDSPYFGCVSRWGNIQTHRNVLLSAIGGLRFLLPLQLQG